MILSWANPVLAHDWALELAVRLEEATSVVSLIPLIVHKIFFLRHHGKIA
jgi:hypothetical protein